MVRPALYCAGDGFGKRAEDAVLHGCLPVLSDCLHYHTTHTPCLPLLTQVFCMHDPSLTKFQLPYLLD